MWEMLLYFVLLMLSQNTAERRLARGLKGDSASLFRSEPPSLIYQNKPPALPTTTHQPPTIQRRREIPISQPAAAQSKATSVAMDSLPTEILGLIMHWEVQMCERQKNTILHLRTVCKAFDLALRTYAFKTVQLEFSRFLRNVPTPNPQSLSEVGTLCESLYLDMMVVRDEGMFDQFY